MKNQILLKKYKLIETTYKDSSNEYIAAKLLNAFGVVVDKPEKADIVFDNKYQAIEKQKVIRFNDIDKFIKLLTV